MRRLVLMRHAKAERGSAGMDDFDRGLTDRGRTDAALISGLLAKDRLKPDLVLVSAAKRTTQTWEAAAQHFPDARVEYRRNLYHAEAQTLLNAIEAEEDQVETLMVIGHNPGVHALAAHLLRQGSAAPSVMAKFDRGFPTASAAVFEIDAAGRASYDGLYLAAEHGGGGGE